MINFILEVLLSHTRALLMIVNRNIYFICNKSYFIIKYCYVCKLQIKYFVRSILFHIFNIFLRVI